MITFTKGTWILDVKNGSIKLQKDGSEIATVCHAKRNSETYTDEGAANARLIAKAPEMYKALDRVIEYAYAAYEQSNAKSIQKDINSVEALFMYIDGKKEEIRKE